MITLTCKQRYMVSNNGTSFSAYEINEKFFKNLILMMMMMVSFF